MVRVHMIAVVDVVVFELSAEQSVRAPTCHLRSRLGASRYCMWSEEHLSPCTAGRNDRGHKYVVNACHLHVVFDVLFAPSDNV